MHLKCGVGILHMIHRTRSIEVAPVDRRRDGGAGTAATHANVSGPRKVVRRKTGDSESPGTASVRRRISLGTLARISVFTLQHMYTTTADLQAVAGVRSVLQRVSLPAESPTVPEQTNEQEILPVCALSLLYEDAKMWSCTRCCPDAADQSLTLCCSYYGICT
jgi:hypothetical protein